MRVSQCIECKSFPCKDVKRDCYAVPDINVKPEDIRMFMVSEAAPQDALFEETTVLAFNNAGEQVSSMKDILKRGIYVTTAVKCGKTSYTIKSDTIKECSHLLEKELALFPNVKVLMLMGDVAIKALNFIAQRMGQKRVIPAIPTYKLRGQTFSFNGIQVIPSYLQAGQSVFIEKGKQKVIANDIVAGLRLANA